LIKRVERPDSFAHLAVDDTKENEEKKTLESIGENMEGRPDKSLGTGAEGSSLDGATLEVSFIFALRIGSWTITS